MTGLGSSVTLISLVRNKVIYTESVSNTCMIDTYEYLRRVSKRAYPVPALVDVPRRKRLDPAKAVTKLREAVSTSKHGGRPDKKAKFFRHFKNHPDCQ